MTRSALLVACFALLPAAVAQDLQLSCRLEPETVPVGGRMEAVVSLANVSSQAIDLPRLAFDRQLVTLEVQLAGGEPFAYERIHPSSYQPRVDWPRAQLGPGEKWEHRIGIPALKVGAVQVTAHLAWLARLELSGIKPLVDPLKSSTATGTVTPDAKGNDTVEWRMVTAYGPMRARLFVDLAPGTCLHMAELVMAGKDASEGGLVRPGFFDGLTFHRVIPSFMIQGGDPEGTGMGGPGYSIPGEQKDAPVPDQAKHLSGRLSMAKSSIQSATPAQNKDSGGSQFFVCTGAPTHLDGLHVVWGELVRGHDVADTITRVPTTEMPGGEQSRPINPVIIRSARIVPTKAR